MGVLLVGCDEIGVWEWDEERGHDLPHERADVPLFGGFDWFFHLVS
jgi:hypothetical protein